MDLRNSGWMFLFVLSQGGFEWWCNELCSEWWKVSFGDLRMEIAVDGSYSKYN